jgi:hypothetical protein
MIFSENSTMANVKCQYPHLAAISVDSSLNQSANGESGEKCGQS